MSDPQMKDLLEAGVHFGHQTRRWNPKMRRFIFAERSGIYLIDLQKTVQQLQKAQELVREVVMRGDGILFVCTKRQLKQIVRDEAIRCDAFYVTERWLGGLLTNFHTIKQQIRRLREIEQGQEEGAFEFFTKKERLRIERERQKLNRNLEGIKRMGRLPGMIFVVDAQRERIAIAEANKLKIPVAAIVDTNADPDVITVPIPGNDDAIRSVSVITQAIVDVVAEARSQVPLRESAAADGESYTYSTDSGGQQGDVDEHRKRRRPRRKRRAKPEAIVARLKATGEKPADQAADDGADKPDPDAPAAAKSAPAAEPAATKAAPVAKPAAPKAAPAAKPDAPKAAPAAKPAAPKAAPAAKPAAPKAAPAAKPAAPAAEAEQARSKAATAGEAEA